MGLAGRAMKVALAGNKAYLGEESRLQVIDISDLSAPRRLGGYATKELRDIAVSGAYGYLDLGVDGLGVVDLSMPTNPTLVATVSNVSGLGVRLSGECAYVPTGDGLFVVDISTPTRPVNVGKFMMAGCYNINIFGNHGYGCGTDDMLLLDMNQPLKPQLVGDYSCFDHHSLKVVEGGAYAFLLESDDERECTFIRTLDISNPVQPVRVGQYDPQGWFYSLAISDHFLYLAGRRHEYDHEGQLRVIDISNPRELKLVGQCATESIPRAIAVSGSTICMAEDDAGLQVYTIPPVLTSIVLRGREVAVSWEAFGVAVLQRTPSLSSPAWADVVGSATTNQMVFAVEGGSSFFRLIRR